MLKTTQAITGLFFLTFLLIHLANTWLASFGSEAYDGAQKVLRTVYQHPVIEIMLLAAIGLHIVVGVLRRLREKGQATTGRAKWHRITGYGLTVVIGGHILAVRGSSWFYGVYPEFAGLAFSIDYAPWYFFPYYFLLATGGFYHGINGAGIALSRLKIGRTLNFRSLNYNALTRATFAAGLATLLALLGFAGIWTDTGDPYSSEFAQLTLRLIDEISN